MFTTQFLLTSLVVVLMPGTGTLYTISTGIARDWRASIAAAIGCTFGIIPHLLASALGLSTLMHISAEVFSVVKYVGSAYLLYLAWQMWKETGGVEIGRLGRETTEPNLVQVAWKGIAINLLNPKLTAFFLAFLPQFITREGVSVTQQFLGLSVAFMLMTLAVFCMYGFIASGARRVLGAKPRAMRWVQRSFALVFGGLAVELAFTRR